MNEISKEAKIASNLKLGVYNRIYKDVIIENDVEIGDFCSIGVPSAGAKGKPLIIRSGSVIRSHSCLYAGSDLGANLQTGHHVLIRENAKIGCNFRLGSYSSIEGDCEIGEYNNCHGYSQIGKGSKIGDFVWIYSQVTLTNDPLPPSEIMRPVTLEDGVVICVNCIILPGTIMRFGSYATAGTYIYGDIPAAKIVSGKDSAVRGHVKSIVDFETGISHPWMRHFKGRYPKEAWQRIEDLQSKIISTR